MSNNKYKVLVVEDDENIRRVIETILEANGYQALCASTCSQGFVMFSSHIPDVIILDLGLPDRDGVEFIKKARDGSGVPIIVVSARTTEKDKIEALDSGANDYVTKPFGAGELLARIRASLRSNRSRTGDDCAPVSKFTVGDMVIDYDRRSVTVGAKDVKLTQTEFNILALLSCHPGKVLTYASMVRSVWGGSDNGGTKKLQVNMANIRKKLGDMPGEQKYIINELGVGYRMADSADEQE